jgi:dihydroorotate dehydrogenase electron transfer subunit
VSDATMGVRAGEVDAAGRRGTVTPGIPHDRDETDGSHATVAGIGRPTLPRPARVRDVTVENYRTRTIRLDVGIDAEPGQFAMVWLPGLDEKPFSLLDDEPLSFTVAAVGPFSRAVHRLAPGDAAWFRAPYGRGFRRAGDDHLLVGGGYGVAPLLFLARRLRANGDRVRVVIGARTNDDLLHIEAFRALDVELRLATEDGSAGTRGVVTDVVRPLVASEPPSAVYACGPHGMLAAVEALATEAGVAAQLSWEAYMRCGIGVCGSCEHRGLLLCVDGPVIGSVATRAPGASVP